MLRCQPINCAFFVDPSHFFVYHQNMDTKAIGNRIRELRKRKALSRKKLAEMAGVHRNTIFLLESGRLKSVQLSTLDALCEALGVKLGRIW